MLQTLRALKLLAAVGAARASKQLSLQNGDGTKTTITQERPEFGSRIFCAAFRAAEMCQTIGTFSL
jgi:hypothetical protein